MIYYQVVLRVAPENLEEFQQVFQMELELAAKYGRKLVGAWQTQVGPTIPIEITNMWAFEDLAHRQRFDEAWVKDKDRGEIHAKLSKLMLEANTKFLTPLLNSPLK